MAVHEQEIDTKKTRKEREKHLKKKRSMDMHTLQSLLTFNLVCLCLILAPSLYLNLCHNQVARVVYQEIIENSKSIYNIPRVATKDRLEIWWDVDVQTVAKVKKNKPDIMLWKHEEKQAN